MRHASSSGHYNCSHCTPWRSRWRATCLQTGKMPDNRRACRLTATQATKGGTAVFMGVSPSSTPPSSPSAPSPSRTLSLSTHYQCHSGRLVPRDGSSAPHPAPWIRMPPLPRRLPRRLQHLVMLPRTLPAPQVSFLNHSSILRRASSQHCVWYILDIGFFSYISLAEAIVSDLNHGRVSVISYMHGTLDYDFVHFQACRTLQVNHPRASGSAECAGCKGTPSPRARST